MDVLAKNHKYNYQHWLYVPFWFFFFYKLFHLNKLHPQWLLNIKKSRILLLILHFLSKRKYLCVTVSFQPTDGVSNLTRVWGLRLARIFGCVCAPEGDACWLMAGREAFPAAVWGGGISGNGVMDRTAVVKVGAAASASVCALFGGVVLAQYIVAKKKRAGKKTRIIEMVSQSRHAGFA